MAFFRANDDCERVYRHSLAECEAQRCKDCEIPVVFRIPKYSFFTESHLKYYGYDPEYIKPQLKKGDKVQLEGEFSQSKESNRPSFTCSAYQIIKE